jgi:FAD/FMN-containing dehydrogenase
MSLNNVSISEDFMGVETKERLLRLLVEIVGKDGVRADEESASVYGIDWTTVHTPNPCAVVLPKTIEQVAALVGFANREGLAVVSSGGRTGLRSSSRTGRIAYCFR